MALRRIIFIATILKVLAVSLYLPSSPQKDIRVKSALSDRGESPELMITIVYDDNSYKEDLRTGWGFSCLVKGLEKTILFDTGSDGSVLLSNMNKLKLDPKAVDIIVLSHVHNDHIGGLAAVLQKNPEVIVYLPKSFPENAKDRVRKHGAKLVEVQKPMEICKGAWSTGELGFWLKEQSLILRTKKGLVLLTGCAHPGIVKIVEKAKELLKGKVHLVVGGFHLAGLGSEEIKKIVADFRKWGVERVAPCHCSGELAKKLFSNAYGKDFVSAGVGKIVEIREEKRR